MSIASMREMWVGALDSGEFKQAEGSLYDDVADGYCCLGVAAVCAGKKKEELEEFSLLVDSLYPVAREFGLSDEDQEVLARLNDEGDGNLDDAGPWTFAEIAQLIALSTVSGMSIGDIDDSYAEDEDEG